MGDNVGILVVKKYRDLDKYLQVEVITEVLKICCINRVAQVPYRLEGYFLIVSLFHTCKVAISIRFVVVVVQIVDTFKRNVFNVVHENTRGIRARGQIRNKLGLKTYFVHNAGSITTQIQRLAMGQS